MYDHCILVKEVALKIAGEVGGDLELVALGALLHDIGKTHQATSDTLHTDHQLFNLGMSEGHIAQLNLSPDDLHKLRLLIAYEFEGVEMAIIKDADTIALYKDPRLYMLFIEWAVAEGLDWAIQRKIAKADQLNFDISREMSQPALDQMVHDWEQYQSRLGGQA